MLDYPQWNLLVPVGYGEIQFMRPETGIFIVISSLMDSKTSNKPEWIQKKLNS